MDSASYQAQVWLSDSLMNQPRKLEVFVLRSIDIVTPSGIPDADFTQIKRKFRLADPAFDTPDQIDVVLGADVYEQVIQPGIYHWGSLIAQQSVFGWVITGRVTGSTSKQSTSNSCTSFLQSEAETSHEALLGLVQRFWSLEEVPQAHRVSPADLECERIYEAGCSRKLDGRYVVPLPLKSEIVALLEDGLPQARAALASAHRRMEKDRELRDHYCLFMENYEQLGHMRLLTEEELADTSMPVHYIPHHGIWQRSDSGRNLRVVFNASRPTGSGYSHNDALLAGPKLQSHISSVITR